MIDPLTQRSQIGLVGHLVLDSMFVIWDFEDYTAVTQQPVLCVCGTWQLFSQRRLTPRTDVLSEQDWNSVFMLAGDVVSRVLVIVGNMKPFGKEPFSWKSDPEYQQEKKQKLGRLHDKILIQETETHKDKYGYIAKKQIPLDKPLSQDLLDSKKKRYQNIVDEQLKVQAEETPVHPYHRVLSQGAQKPQPKSSSTNEGRLQYKQPQKSIKPPSKMIPPSSQNKSKQAVKKPEKCSEFLYQRYGGVSGPDAHLIQMLEKEVMSKQSSMTLDDIADLDKAKSLLQEAVLLPLLLPNFFQGIRRPWKGVLMFGPPGTGKTMLAKAVAATSNMKFFNISASSLASKWKGESQKLVRLLFQMARFYAPSIVFIDQIDSIASRRSQDECQATRKVKTELLVQLDGAGVETDKQVILLAATNRPWDIDEALRRRLEKRIYIPLPNDNGRKQLLIKSTAGIKVSPNIDFDLLSKKTKGFSGADIVVFVRSASFLPLRRYLKKAGFKQENFEKCKEEVDVPVTQEDFLEALSQCNPSVGRQDLTRYSQWMQEFGST